MKARWWRRENDGQAARCGLCFHSCLIPEGQAGWCGTRFYDGGELASPYLGRFSSFAVDPIEKKPLRHWRPGSLIFSLGGVGCTMRCPFCQNHGIAQPTGAIRLTEIGIPELVDKTRELKLAAVAYTYNEPTLEAEYILAAAPKLRNAGIATVLVTNGLFSKEALDELIPWIDAANVDVKSFNTEAYAAMGGSLSAVRRNVAALVEAGAHIELTTLVVPGISDDPAEFAALADWIAGLSPDIPFHISRYFPAHRYGRPATDADLLRRFQKLAEARLRHVYLGNLR